MEEVRERYDRATRQRADDKLDKARANFRTKIAASMNKAKSCESGENRNAGEIWREK